MGQITHSENEYIDGKYGQYIKWFESENTYIEYATDEDNQHNLPNVAYCELEEKVKYNWEMPSEIVLSADKNPNFYNLLHLSGIGEESTIDGETGYTTQDLANITLSEMTVGTDTSENPDEKGRNISIFFRYMDIAGGMPGGDDVYEGDDDIVGRDYGYDRNQRVSTQDALDLTEFQYFTITEIPDDFFNNCRALTKIIIPSTVAYIGHNAFHDCGSLTSITIMNNEEDVNIESDAFAYAGTIFSSPSSWYDLDYYGGATPIQFIS